MGARFLTREGVCRNPVTGEYGRPENNKGFVGMIRILLAEDEEAMRTYLARALVNAGYDVVAVDRGTAALPYLQQEHFDLLLSDIVMPEMDGIELAQRCAEISPQTKPFHLRDLVAEVQRIFDHQNQLSI
jgi:two-component system cell cycle response regulator CpdR